MGFTPTEKIWFNGKLVAWDDAKVHVLAHQPEEPVDIGRGGAARLYLVGCHASLVSRSSTMWAVFTMTVASAVSM